MDGVAKRRRAVVIFITSVLSTLLLIWASPNEIVIDNNKSPTSKLADTISNGELAKKVLAKLEIKGRAPKTGYDRSEFGEGWAKVGGCSTREIILYRDLVDVTLSDDCTVASGILDDPYTGGKISFTRDKSSEVQIDHVIALSDAWQKGAQNLSKSDRIRLANDPLELLAVSGQANQQKSDGDAATWLPKNKSFRCEYVARQIAIKYKYSLWVSKSEHDAMRRVLDGCGDYKIDRTWLVGRLNY